MLVKVLFIRHSAIIDVTSSLVEAMIFNPKKMLGKVDLRLIG